MLQERAFYRVGGSQEIRVDVRVIAATHVDLRRAVEEGRFRDDLFYRLNVIEIRIPPLRERREDVPLLARHFIERLSHELGKAVCDISEGGLRVLLDWDWPGNVRELENAVERAIVTCRGRVITEDDLAFLKNARSAQPWTVPPNMTLAGTGEAGHRGHAGADAGEHQGSGAALGIDRSTLYEKIKRYEIPR